MYKADLTLIFWRNWWPEIKQESSVNLCHEKVINEFQKSLWEIRYGGIEKFYSWAYFKGEIVR